MSKVYEFESKNNYKNCLKMSFFSDLIYKKHSKKYNKKGAEKTRSAATKILGDALIQQKDQDNTNNILLVGKVQSGKTSNLEAIVGLALDNGFNLIVMYGGYDNTLLKQSVKRFRKVFDSPKDDDDDKIWNKNSPNIFSTDCKDDLCINDLDAKTIQKFIKRSIPVFIITIKDSRRIQSINDNLKELDSNLVTSLVIDDEGDQASLNNMKDKQNDASATYDAICKMKKALNNPIYFSVTATPQANIFLDKYSELRPGSVKLLPPSSGYCGAEFFHVNDNNIVHTIPDEMESAIENNTSPQSLQNAIQYFILASAIYNRLTKNKKNKKTQMIVHTNREIDTHELIYTWIYQHITTMKCEVKSALENNGDEAKIRFRHVYNDFLDHGIKKNIPFDNSLIKEIDNVLDNTGIAMQNGKDKGTRQSVKFRLHQIFIGADLLQRGLTFDTLLTTYFTRWPKTDGNMDTNLQRARWFGYRQAYSDLIKIFTTEKIADEFSFLAGTEEDLWRQFDEVEVGRIPISEIVIRAKGSKQKPTRKSVVDYFSVYTSAWIKQTYKTSDKQEIEHNNSCVDQFLNEHDFMEKSYGRKDNKPSCTETICASKDAVNLIKSLKGIYVRDFRRHEVITILNKSTKVAVVLMTPNGQKRQRSFYPHELKNKIKALHQGRSGANSTAYSGDKMVVSNLECITLQIFRILPIENSKALPEETQYMFALYNRSDLEKGWMKA